MSASERWEPGTIVLFQEVWRGKLWSARPVRVVEDRNDLLVLWCPEGTPVKGPVAPWRPGRSSGAEFFVSMFTHMDWIFGDFAWPTTNLMLLRPEEWHAVWVSWTSAGDAMGWYVNFQRPFTRTELGIQTMDLMLDLIVDGNRSWRWKDEEEFDALVSAGILSDVEAEQVREDARTVVDRITANAPPFSQPWHDWRPDPSWPMPLLSEGWDRL